MKGSLQRKNDNIVCIYNVFLRGEIAASVSIAFFVTAPVVPVQLKTHVGTIYST